MENQLPDSLYHSPEPNPPKATDPFFQQPQSQDRSPDAKKRYKRCCIKCKHTEKGRRSCVCVVPLGQRRTAIGNNGCQTCGCNGCSIEDYVNRGEDPEYKPTAKKESEDFDFQARNGCCKNCMKAFSKYNKSCLCQVPKEVRKSELPTSGCKICHCHGCHPEDKREWDNGRDREDSFEVDHSRARKKRHVEKSSESDSGSNNEIEVPLNNMEKTPIGVLFAESGMYAPMLGLGVPQRIYSYIIGRPPPK